MKSKIFINYRKDDSPWNSLALYQELIKHFGKENIFKDFNTILPGTDFVESIEEALESCDVLLVLISEHWADIKDKNGNPRIDNPDDFVRLEIATALRRNIKVIPVLFDNAVLPPATELPDDLKKLSRRQFIEIDKTRFEADTARLVETIKSILTPIGPGPDKRGDTKPGGDIKKEVANNGEPIVIPGRGVISPTSQKNSVTRKRSIILVVLTGIMILSYFLFNFLSNKKEQDNASVPAANDTTVDNIDTGKKTAIIKTPEILPPSKKEDRNTIAKNNKAKEEPREKTGNNVVPKKPGQASEIFENFPAAYAAVFKDAASNFINVRGDSFPNRRPDMQAYKTKVTIRDSSAKPASILFRNNEWAFSFILRGPAAKEDDRFRATDKLIVEVFYKNRLRHQKTPVKYRSENNPLQSYEYRRLPYRVQLNRAIIGDNYNYVVAIYHAIN